MDLGRQRGGNTVVSVIVVLFRFEQILLLFRGYFFKDLQSSARRANIPELRVSRRHLADDASERWASGRVNQVFGFLVPLQVVHKAVAREGALSS